MAKIVYTHTDEAPALATYSFLPIVEAFAAPAAWLALLAFFAIPAGAYAYADRLARR